MSVIVYGPQGIGKTKHAKKLAAHFKCDRVVEDGYDDTFSRGIWRSLNSPAQLARFKRLNVLVITNESPPERLDEEASRRVLPFHQAMHIAGITPTGR